MKRLMMKTIIDYQNDEREKVLLDVRDKQEFEKETYPGARNWYWEELIKVLEETPEEFTQQFDKSVPIYLLCYTGLHSDDLADILEEMGYEVYSLYGGWGAYMKWKFENYVKEAQAENELSGEERVKEIERSIVKKFRKPIWRKFTQALNEYDLIQDGDKIAVCISGGKDSMLMAKLFQELKRHGKNNFELVFLVMNPGYNDINYQVILNNAKILDIPITVFKSEIFDTVADIEESPCYLCARMRRGYLYSKAKELGCNKIALGHHYDDVIETILMGMLYGAQIQTMMPKLHSTNFEGMELIRPLYLIREADIIHWLKIVIQQNEGFTVSTNEVYDVSTYIGTTLVDTQKAVKAVSDLSDNDYLHWKGSEALTENAGLLLTGGTTGAVQDAAYQTFLDKIEPYSFNAVGCDMRLGH